jgi:hypothetical protein
MASFKAIATRTGKGGGPTRAAQFAKRVLARKGAGKGARGGKGGGKGGGGI